jgi:hypothetical protein
MGIEIIGASTTQHSLFSLGRVFGTPAALDAMHRANVTATELLLRHHSGDWGDINSEDIGLNEAALEIGARIFSVYKLAQTGATIWVITEADRSSTTLLLPEDY